MNIGEKIKKYRKQKKLTQPQLAKLINKSESTIRKYENGDVIPSIEICQQIADVLEIDIDKILAYSPAEKMELDTIEIIYDFIDKFLIRCGEHKILEKMSLPEQMELALNIKSILDNKIDKIKEGSYRY